MTVLESIVLITSHLLQLLLSLQYHRTSIRITRAVISFQYFVHEVGFQVFIANVSKSIPIPCTGTQQNPPAKQWDQTSLYWIRKLNYENLLSCWRVQVQANFFGGLVYTGIAKTCDDGCGSMGQPLISLPGILENQTIMVQTRIVWNLEWCQRNGMIIHVITVVLTLVNSIVSTASFMNTYTSRQLMVWLNWF